MFLIHLERIRIFAPKVVVCAFPTLIVFEVRGIMLGTNICIVSPFINRYPTITLATPAEQRLAKTSCLMWRIDRLLEQGTFRFWEQSV